jgi:hypothetical protein
MNVLKSETLNNALGHRTMSIKSNEKLNSVYFLFQC